MDAAAAAVTIIVINSLILAFMAGIVGYTVGRARAVKKISKEEEILFSYRDIAVEAMPIFLFHFDTIVA
jgi:hypothetical protein